MAQVEGLYERPIDWDNQSYDEFQDMLEDIKDGNQRKY